MLRISGFHKQLILYLFCIVILFAGIFCGIKNVNTVENDESSFWAEKRVEYSQYLSIIENGNFESVPVSFFIARAM